MGKTIKFDLVDYGNGTDYGIEQASVFRYLTFLFEGDLRKSENAAEQFTYVGEIRDNYIHNDGKIVASFEFAEARYAQFELSDGRIFLGSNVEPILGSKATYDLAQKWYERGMKKRKKIKCCDTESILFEDFKPGINCWVYEIRVESIFDFTKINRLIEGFVEVRPTTNGAFIGGINPGG